MGLLSRLLGKSTPVFRVEGWRVSIKLPRSVTTLLGGRVRCIGCNIDLDYKMSDGRMQIVGVRLTNPAPGETNVLARANVWGTHTGQCWEANSELKRFLERDILPGMIQEVIANDEALQRAMRARGPATPKQKAFALELGIKFDEAISKREISKLIDEKLNQERGHS